ncbi:hypothetical protein QR680_000880 [Steinernema hermaphroditum]|uniref:Uncharacterized protein n=1 Tax=Steinernema hermaphroditum TaxID=289476 RepID=A0AA39LEF5_9BILA|nr:hypothetical protein QR680_000880 [Steinernema hermaphroditum]
MHGNPSPSTTHKEIDHVLGVMNEINAVEGDTVAELMLRMKGQQPSEWEEFQLEIVSEFSAFVCSAREHVEKPVQLDIVNGFIDSFAIALGYALRAVEEKDKKLVELERQLMECKKGEQNANDKLARMQDFTKQNAALIEEVNHLREVKTEMESNLQSTKQTIDKLEKDIKERTAMLKKLKNGFSLLKEKDQEIAKLRTENSHDKRVIANLQYHLHKANNSIHKFYHNGQQGIPIHPLYQPLPAQFRKRTAVVANRHVQDLGQPPFKRQAVVPPNFPQ